MPRRDRADRRDRAGRRDPADRRDRADRTDPADPRSPAAVLPDRPVPVRPAADRTGPIPESSSAPSDGCAVPATRSGRFRWSGHDGGMSEQDQRIVVIGPDGSSVAAPNVEQSDGDDENGRPGIAGLVQQPDKVMRIGTMIKQLLEEVKAAPLDEASRN